MASLPGIAAVLQSRLTALHGVIDSYSWLTEIISWFFVRPPIHPSFFSSLGRERADTDVYTTSKQITLGLSFFLPIAVLIVFDFFLWIWRLLKPANASSTTIRRRRESISRPVSTS